MSTAPGKLTYKDAGVDLDLYEQAMQRLPRLMRQTHSPRVIPLADAFAGLFRLNQEGRSYRDPVLVSGTDGVGTKIKVAILARRYTTVGIDLVAMSINDCLCIGAEPLFFLDYLALGRDDPDLIAALVSGVSEGCIESGAALLGGETAIMPSLYADDDFDMAGFCVGVVEKDQIIDGSTIRPGDVVLGVASSGLHSNGYSLIRKIVFELAGLKIDTHVPELGRTVAEELLEPTRLYARPVRDLLNQLAPREVVHGLAHITGGGLRDNIERILPEQCRVTLDRRTWRVPPVFSWLQGLGDIDTEEMFRTFNMGIGFALLLPREAAETARTLLARQGVDAWVIGEVTEGARAVEYAG